MDATPEPPAKPLLTRPLIVRTFLFFGAIEAALGIAAFFAIFAVQGWRPFDSIDGVAVPEARTLTFIGIVSGQLGCLFAQRDGGILQRLSLRSNRWIVPSLAFELALAVVLVYVPGLNGLFKMTGITPVWLVVLPLGAVLFVLLDHARRLSEAILRGKAAESDPDGHSSLTLRL
jgi:magnesium-transporting ATPase (P-type)